MSPLYQACPVLGRFSWRKAGEWAKLSDIMKRRRLATLLLIAMAVAGVTDDTPWDDLLPEGIGKRLAEEGEIRNTLLDRRPLSLLPEGRAAEIINESYAGSEATITVEFLSDQAFPNNHLTPSEYHLRIFNTLRSISTLSGIEYYSASRGRMRIYLHEAFCIDSPENPVRREDPLVSLIPETDGVFAFLRDSSLGRYIARVDYSYSGRGFVMTLENQTTVRPFLIPLAQPGDLKMHVLLIPAGDRILFYGLAYLKAGDVFGIARSREESFYNRLKALFLWFQDNMDLS